MYVIFKKILNFLNLAFEFRRKFAFNHDIESDDNWWKFQILTPLVWSYGLWIVIYLNNWNRFNENLVFDQF